MFASLIIDLMTDAVALILILLIVGGFLAAIGLASLLSRLDGRRDRDYLRRRAIERARRGERVDR